MGRRRFYIPITRSGSSILASILTQLIEEHRRMKREERLVRGERHGKEKPSSPAYAVGAFIILGGLLTLIIISVIRQCSRGY